MPKRVEVNKTLRGRMNFKGRLLQTNKFCHKAAKKTMQIYDQTKTSAQIVQNLIPCAAHVPPRCKEVTKCQCECHAGIPAAMSASPSKMVAKTAPELAKTQPGGAQDHPKSSTEAPMRAQMRPRAPKKHPKGGQETAQRHPREPKSSPRASKLRRIQAQEAPKPFQKRAWGLPKQAWDMILVRSFSQKAPTAIFCYFWRRTPKPLNSRW